MAKGNKTKKKNQKQKMKMLNSKEEVASDMDAFTDISAGSADKRPTPPPPEINGLLDSPADDCPASTPTVDESTVPLRKPSVSDSEIDRPSEPARSQPTALSDTRLDQTPAPHRTPSPPPPADAAPAPSREVEPPPKEVVPSAPREATPVADKPPTPTPVKEPTPAPKEATPVSREATPVSSKPPIRDTPKEATPTPKEISPAPREVTPAPREVTPTPREVTPAPREATPAPAISVPEDIASDILRKDPPAQSPSPGPAESPAPAPEPATPEPQPAPVEAPEPDVEPEEPAEEPEMNGEEEEEEEAPAVVAKEAKLKLPYKPDQWSPLNPTGKKEYDRTFLLQLQHVGDSMRKPEGMLELPEIVLDEPFHMQRSGGQDFQMPRPPSNMRDFTPSYANKSLGGDARRGSGMGSGGRSRSQQKDLRGEMRGGPAGMKLETPRKIISISIQQDIKLNKAENAWKPKTKEKEKPASAAPAEEDKTGDTLQKARGLLNKLTPQAFSKITIQFTALMADAIHCWKEAIDLVFMKAIDEPSFSGVYAKLCFELGKGLKEVKCDTPVAKLIIKACQFAFESDSLAETDIKQLKEKIAAASEDKKKALMAELEFEEAKSRRRSVGNLRFIGELYKLKMLTTSVIRQCIQKLLKEEDDALEDLCKLLTTVGKNLDDPEANPKFKPQMDQYFTQLLTFTKSKKTSSRVRFMVLDVIDLRSNGWIPRRKEAGPKMIDQIHKEAKDEDQKNAIMADNYHTQQRDQQRRGGGGGMGGGMGGGGHGGRPSPGPPGMGGPGGTDDGWQTAGKSMNTRNLTTMDPSRMKISREEQVTDNIKLGPGSAFGGWARGAGRGVGRSSSMEGERPPAVGNRYSALSRPSGDQGRGGPGTPAGRPSAFGGQDRNRDNRDPRGRLSLTPSQGKNMARMSSERDRGAALEAARSVFGHGSPAASPRASPRSSPRGSRDSSLARDQRDSPRDTSRDPRDVDQRQFMHRVATSPGNLLKDRTVSFASPAAAATGLSEDQMKKKAKAIVDEYLGINDIKEAKLCVEELQPSMSIMHVFVSTALEGCLEKSMDLRHRTGKLLYHLVSCKLVPLETYLQGVAAVLEFADDMSIDIPRIWQYLGEVISPMIQESGAVPLDFLRACLIPLTGCGKRATVLGECLKDAAIELGEENVRDQWRVSGLTFEEFFSERDSLDEFLKRYKLQFLHEAPAPPSLDSIRAALHGMIEAEQPADVATMISWIVEHVPPEVRKGSPFIRLLVTAICQAASQRFTQDHNNEELRSQLRHYQDLFNRFLDHDATRELDALYALQAMVHRMEHPKDLLCLLFELNYDEDIISEDAYQSWKVSNDPKESVGRGVAMANVRSFFEWLDKAEGDP